MIVYGVVNNVNQKMYVGQTIRTLEKRKNQHLWQKVNSIFYRALNKYGKDNFSWFILRECHSRTEMNYWEDFYIRLFQSFGKYGYNMRSDSNGYNITEETRKKMSLAKLKNPVKYWLGKKHTPESKIKMSRKARERPLSFYKNRKKKVYVSGWKHTEESKTHMSEAAKNRPPVSDETKRKLSEAQKRRWLKTRNNITIKQN